MPSPVLPAPRIAYDRDGSFAFVSRNVGSDRWPFTVQPNALARLNADDMGGLAVPSTWWNINNPMPSEHFLSIVFPTPMHIIAWMGSARARFTRTVGVVTYTTDIGLELELQTSRDTTNGMDGEWETVRIKPSEDFHLPFSTEGTGLYPDDTTPSGGFSGIRENDTSDGKLWPNSDEAGLGWQYVFGPGRRYVQGLRIRIPKKPAEAESNFQWAILQLHLYGYPDETATEDRLAVLDGTTEDPLTDDIGFGDVDLNAVVQRSIKIQNLSTTLTAEGVEATVASGFRTGTPESVDSLALSLDGVTWGPTATLGDLAPGAISDEILIRLDPEAGIIGQRFARVEAEVEEWT